MNRYNNNRNNQQKPKCQDCDSFEIKKRKNFSHGSNSKAKISYLCTKCNSTNISTNNNKRFIKR